LLNRSSLGAYIAQPVGFHRPMLFLVVLGEDSGRGAYRTYRWRSGYRSYRRRSGYRKWRNRKQKRNSLVGASGKIIRVNIVTVARYWWPWYHAEMVAEYSCPDYNCFPTFSISIKYYEIPSWRKLSRIKWPKDGIAVRNWSARESTVKGEVWKIIATRLQKTDLWILERCGTKTVQKVLNFCWWQLFASSCREAWNHCKNGGLIQTYSCPVLESFLFLLVEEEPQSSFWKEWLGNAK